MLMKKLSAVMLLACLPLFSQPVLAADKAAPKQTTTAEVAKETGKLNICLLYTSDAADERVRV